MYTKIKIVQTEIKDKYLFICENNHFYGGSIIKDIVELLKTKMHNEEIASRISLKYNVKFDKDEISEIIEKKINEQFFSKSQRNGLIKLVKIKLKDSCFSSKLFLLLFKSYFFYTTLTLLLSINLLFFLRNINLKALTLYEKIIGFIIIIFIILCHEIGHIYSAKYYNKNVKELGFGFYFFYPVFYVNLDDIWALNKYKRVLINLSGVYFQSIIGFILLLITYFTPFKTNMLIYVVNVNFLIILLNLIPFFKFDGYWVLSDLIGVNNLNKQAFTYIKNIHKKNDLKPIIKIYALIKFTFMIYIFSILLKKIIQYAI